MSNRKRLKKLILANKETRCLYRMMQFLAIFMVVSCLVVIVIAKWIEYDQNKKQEEVFGSWDEVFLNVEQEDLNYFKKNAFLKQISVQSVQEKVFLEGDQRVVIGACDENFLEMGNIELLEGRMPKHEKEVAVEEEYLGLLGVARIGDTVSNESVVKSLFGYKVVGIVENYSRNWKVINQGINYANCFICDAEVNEIKVYVQYGKWAKKDPEINMIDYRNNIDDIKINLGKILINLIRGFFLIEILLILLILSLLKYIYKRILIGEYNINLNIIFVFFVALFDPMYLIIFFALMPFFRFFKVKNFMIIITMFMIFDMISKIIIDFSLTNYQTVIKELLDYSNINYENLNYVYKAINDAGMRLMVQPKIGLEVENIYLEILPITKIEVILEEFSNILYLLIFSFFMFLQYVNGKYYLNANIFNYMYYYGDIKVWAISRYFGVKRIMCVLSIIFLTFLVNIYQYLDMLANSKILNIYLKYLFLSSLFISLLIVLFCKIVVKKDYDY